MISGAASDTCRLPVAGWKTFKDTDMSMNLIMLASWQHRMTDRAHCRKVCISCLHLTAAGEQLKTFKDRRSILTHAARLRTSPLMETKKRKTVHANQGIWFIFWTRDLPRPTPAPQQEMEEVRPWLAQNQREWGISASDWSKVELFRFFFRPLQTKGHILNIHSVSD